MSSKLLHFDSVQLKSDYRKKYDTLQCEQACLKALNQYVDKARYKLLAEFEEWYRVCYIGGEPVDTTLCEEVELETSPQGKKVGYIRESLVQEGG